MFVAEEPPNYTEPCLCWNYNKHQLCVTLIHAPSTLHHTQIMSEIEYLSKDPEAHSADTARVYSYEDYLFLSGLLLSHHPIS